MNVCATWRSASAPGLVAGVALLPLLVAARLRTVVLLVAEAVDL